MAKQGSIGLGGFAISLICVLLAGCAVNPATGKRQLVLISESQEIAIGQENDQAVSAHSGKCRVISCDTCEKTFAIWPVVSFQSVRSSP